MSGSRRVRMEVAGEDARVTPLELFFDLVFVFALTQVTALMSGDLTWHGLVRGMLVFCLLWWSWTAYAWLGNVVRADLGTVRAVMLVAMAVMFVLALSIPEAFDDLPGGLPGPLVVVVCYFVFRSLHIALFWIISGDDPGLRRQLLRFTPTMLGSTVLLLVAAQLSGAAKTAFWALALLVDYGGTFLGGASGWRLPSAGHFAERHGLILIVALGESIVAIGVGVAAFPVSWPIVTGAALGLTLAATVWWAYFGGTAERAEHALAGEPEDRRPRLARDAYSFEHMPIIAGVVLLALGLKKALEYGGGSEKYDLTDPLPGLALVALYGGVALFLLAHVAFRLQVLRTLSAARVAAAGALLASMPLSAQLPALAALAVVVLVMVFTLEYEALRARAP